MSRKQKSITEWLWWFRSKGGQHLDAAVPYVDKAVAWGLEQRTRLSGQMPTAEDIEVWMRENALRFGWSEKPRSDSLEHLEQILIRTIAAIRQESERRTRIMVNVALSKSAGTVAFVSIAAWVAAFGVASTGTPIAALSGAAATTATLYWMGSLVGLGAAAGGVILAGAGIGISVAAGIWGRKRLIGKPRTDDSLQDHERAIVYASHSLIVAVRAQIKSGDKAKPDDMRLFAEHGLIPLANQINQHWDEASLKEYGKTECQPFTKTLAFYHRRKLDQCRTELGRIAMAAVVAGQKR